MIDYSVVDMSPLLSYIFYPRREHTNCPAGAFDVSVPVDEDVSIVCRFYKGNDAWPWILFFHGNGEVVSDYDDIAPFYRGKSLNLVVADYRGYGASGGSPSLTNLYENAHVVFKTIREELNRRGYADNLYAMGRSLGSLSVLEIARNYQYLVQGLIVESGFANFLRITMRLGLPIYDIDFEGIDRECIRSLQGISVRTLIIHGDCDTLVPPGEGETIYNRISSKEKSLVIISGATHNDIMFAGLEQYFEAIRGFVYSR